MVGYWRRGFHCIIGRWIPECLAMDSQIELVVVICKLEQDQLNKFLLLKNTCKESNILNR
jgi:hypothetical protein